MQRQNFYSYPPSQQSPAHFWTKIITALALLFIPLSLSSSPLQAQPQPETPAQSTRVLWIIQNTLPANAENRALLKTLQLDLWKNLKNTTQTHSVVTSPQQLAALLKKARRPIPPCLDGSEPCNSPTATILQSLDCDQLISGTLSQKSDQSLTLTLTVYDASGTALNTRTYSSPPPQQGGASRNALLQSLLLKATGVTSNTAAKITIQTTPPGATIRLNNNRVGVSPLTLSAPVGEHIIEANLDYHQTSVERIKISPGEQKTVSITLPSSLSQITIDTAPIKASFFLNGKLLKSPQQTLSLYPGNYQVEVRAKNHKTRYVQLQVGKGEQKNISLTLEPDRPSLNLTGLGEVPEDAILARPIFTRASFRYSRLLTGLSAAEGTLRGQDVTTTDNTTDNPNAPELPAYSFYGFNAETGYTWSYFGIVALGVSYTTSPDSFNQGSVSFASSSIPATFTDLSHLEIAPLQLLFRYPYKNLFPTIQTGFGYAYTTFTAETTQGDADMTQDGFFWHFDIEVSYFFDSWFYGFASIGLQRDLSHEDTKTNQNVAIGLGTTFEFPSFSSDDSLPPRQTP